MVFTPSAVACGEMSRTDVDECQTDGQHERFVDEAGAVLHGGGCGRGSAPGRRASQEDVDGEVERVGQTGKGVRPSASRGKSFGKALLKVA